MPECLPVEMAGRWGLFLCQELFVGPSVCLGSSLDWDNLLQPLTLDPLLEPCFNPAAETLR